MAKFYVQSGNFRRVVAADSCRKAALWAVHEVMQQIMPTDQDSDTGMADRAASRHYGDEGAATSVTVLSGKVRVDERGFDRHDASELSTMEVIGEWNQMVMTLDRLQQMLDGKSPSEKVIGDRFSDDQFSDDLAA